ncbi:hypothetical protein OOT46_10330 [Aquabacterium sp. A7-Y]|uniref:hypothetical protein n=1 Tax=Aquabacterium sp. A7-Y TaxID=1349605 RepID=UPI00223DD52B|nr:hypothetical protein [Aquabacterium sp. A7-Y]MCW7538243.1 hypothetical protein [Aquabacterium sp. A7-Y]
MVKRKSEAVTPPEVVERLLGTAEDDILIGGQALAFWVQRYGLSVPAKFPAISNDVDFLTSSPAGRERVAAFARAIRGATYFPSERALTALVGQAYVDLSEDEVINVDVLFQVFGIDAEAVRERAVRVQMSGMDFLVMHPLHVLRSRLLNLYKLPEKQDDKGVMQVRMAIDVAREFLRQELRLSKNADLETGRSPIQAYVSEIERLAIEDAGRKVAQRFGIHIADAIDPTLIPPGPFWVNRWPGLKEMMSLEYSSRFQAPEPAARPLKRRKS